MKKILLLTLILSLVFSSALATDKRVQAMGNNAYMLIGDDTGIGLFPQRINDLNLIRFTDIETATPDYLLVIGEPGKTWGFWGGNNQKDDYFNIIRSLGGKSALSLGLQVGRSSLTETTSNEETTAPVETDETISQTNLMVDVQYGLDAGDTEFSAYFTFGLAPATIGVIAPYAGSYTGEFKTGSTTSNADGSASLTTLAFQTMMRAKKGFSIFDYSYAVFGFQYQGGSSEYTDTTNTKLEDESGSFFSINSTYRLFNNIRIANDKILLLYGLGGGMYFSRDFSENKLQPGDESTTDIKFELFGPILNIGIEAELKYTTLRFGMERQIKTFQFTKETYEYDPQDGGTTKDIDTESELTIGGKGVYNYNAGIGFNYGDLEINILLNNNFWISGPQMIFDYDPIIGSLGICADMIYRF